MELGRAQSGLASGARANRPGGSLRRAAIALFASLCAAGASAKDDEAWVTRWRTFEIVRNRIHVPMKVAGADATALFDTGSIAGYVDRAFAEANGVNVAEGQRIRVHGMNSTKDVAIAREVPVELFGAKLSLRNIPAGRLPSAQLIIGQDVLRLFVLQIDFANSRMRFASRAAVRLDAVANVEMRREAASGLPAVRAVVDGDPVWLMLDTGMAGPMHLRASVVEGRGWEKLKDSKATDVHGTTRGVEIYRVPLLQLGPFDLRGVEAVVTRKGHVSREAARRAESGVRTVGILGAEVLRHFVVTMDLKERKLHLGLASDLESRAAAATTAGDPAPAPEATSAPEEGAIDTERPSP